MKVVRTMFVCVVVFGVGGCASTTKERRIEVPEPVTDLEGFSNAFRVDNILFAGQPDVRGLQRVARAGIHTVVNIRTDAEMTEKVKFDEDKVVRALRMDYVRIPVTPDSLTAADADRLAEVLESNSKPVLIHCSSANRVGGLWALYLYRHRGFTLDDAIAYGVTAGLRKDSMVEATRRAAEEASPLPEE